MNATHHAPTSKPSLYERITSRIVTSLEKGVRPWVQPWTSPHAAGAVSRPLRHNGTPYAGINVLALWCAAAERGFAAPYWMTFRQATELGAHVRKGETGSLVVYARSIMVDEDRGDEDADAERQLHFLKGYTVFNVEQIEGLPDHYHATRRAEPVHSEARIARVERFMAATGATIRYGGARASYAPAADFVHLDGRERAALGLRGGRRPRGRPPAARSRRGRSRARATGHVRGFDYFGRHRSRAGNRRTRVGSRSSSTVRRRATAMEAARA